MEPRLYLLLVALGALPIVGLSCAVNHVDRKTLDRIELENDLLEGEIDALAKIADGAGDLEGVAADLEARLETIVGLTAQRTHAQDVLSVVEAAVPPHVQLTSLTLDDAGLRLRGKGDASAAADVMDGLRAFDCMAQVSLSGAGSGRFDVRAILRPDAPCPPGEAGRRDLFANPFASPAGGGDARVAAVVRWPVRDYAVLATEPGGDAILEDPAGGSHLVKVGSVVGVEYARVTVVAEGQVILTRDVVTDAALGKLESHLITLHGAR